MELHKLTTEEMRNWDTKRLREVSADVRKELAFLRMDIYTQKSKLSGKFRGLRRSLARVLTVLNEKGTKS